MSDRLLQTTIMFSMSEGKSGLFCNDNVLPRNREEIGIEIHSNLKTW